MENRYFKEPKLSGKFDGKDQYSLIDNTANLDSASVEELFENLELPCHLNIGNIKVTNSFFEKLRSLEGNNYSFFQCTIPETLSFNQLKKTRIHLTECTFEKDTLDIEGGKRVFFSISRSINLLSINIDKCEKSGFQLTRDSTHNIIMTGNRTVDLYLHYCETELNLKIEGNEIDEFEIEYCKLNSIKNEHSYINNFKLKHCTFKSLSIFANIYKEDEPDRFNINSLIIEGNRFGKLLLSGYPREDHNNLKIDEIELINTDNIYTDYIYCRVLKISGKEYNNMEFNNSELSNIEFKDFVNNGKFKFRHIQVNEKNKNSSLSLSNSVLSGIVFDRSFLHIFKNLSLEESTVSDIVLHYFKPISNSVIKKAKATNSAKIEFCRELTALMKDQNNSHYATSYRALEQNFRLRERYKKFNLFNSDTFILTLNKITNNHGTQPFFALINLFMLIGFYHLALTKEFSLNESNLDALNIMKSNIGYFFKPLTFISDIESIEYDFSFGFRLWDILYKILYAYLVFQFIAAFRKFNK